MNKWTVSQQNAIDSRGGTLLVSAAAGSGKTAVLVERIIKILLDEKNPVDVDKLLVVTFTNAAAAEMKERVNRAIDEKLLSDSENRHLRRQQMLINDAKICTIDAFCKDIVKENFYQLNIAQDFDILDESRHTLLKQEACDNVLEQFYAKGNQNFLSLVELLSDSRSDVGLTSYIFKTYDYVMAYPFPEKWLDEATAQYRDGGDVEATIWGNILISKVKSIIDYAYSCLRGAASQIKNDDELAAALKELTDSDFLSLERLRQTEGWDSLYTAVRKLDFKRFSCPKALREIPAAVRYKNTRSRVKKIVTEKCAKLLCATEKEHSEDLTKLFGAVSAFTDVVKAFADELMRLKMLENAFSFADIEHFALNLLVEEKDGTFQSTLIAEEMKNHYHEILLDEYQDTNKAQEMLFNSVSKGNNIFMVGDVKQSIYRFRQAMPQIFIEKKESYSKYDGKTFPATVVLDKNFRSRKEICQYINFVFSNLFSKEIGEIEYGEDEMLNYGASYPEAQSPVIQLSVIEQSAFDFKIKDELEANYLVKLIKEKINSKEQVCLKDGTQRDIRYGDIAILLRSAKSHIPNYVQVFRKAGIPISGESGNDFFQTPEISLMMSLLRVIDNPVQDIPLLSIMSSAAFGFTPDELALMRMAADKGASLYVCVKNYADSGDMKTKDFLSCVDKMRTYSCTMPVGELLRKIYDETSFFAVACAMGEGEQRRLNLNYLIEFASSYKQSGNNSLSAFIRYIDRLCDSGESFQCAGSAGSAGNSVQIMSIHRSKGLEFPCCILAGMGTKFNKQGLAATDIHLHPDYGIGIRYFDDELSYKYDTVPYRALSVANETAEMSEYLRVLYVAMTRAKEQLIVVSTIDKVQSKVSSLAASLSVGTIPPYAVGSALSDSDWLLSCALLHPDGKILRKMADSDIPVQPADFSMKIEFIDSLGQSIDEKTVYETPADEILLKNIEEKLSFVYPYRELALLASKRNASSLDDAEFEFEHFATSRPAFAISGGLCAAQKGTAMHQFMQSCDYLKCAVSVAGEAQRLLDKGYLSRLEYESLDIGALSHFFESTLARRMFASEKLLREIKFASFVKAEEIYPDIDASGEKVYVQGIADCAFYENDGLVVVDYKTDKVKDGASLLAKYEKQLRFYCSALEKTLRKPVKECMLYSFYLEKILRYDFI